MNQTVPPGYRALVPFDRDHHRRRGIIQHAARFAAALSFVYLDALEFVRASRQLPIVFAFDANGALVPGAQTGVEPGRNLFVDPAGDWLDTVYCPVYVRRYPFYLARVTEQGREQSLVCVDESGLTDRKPWLLDGDGQATSAWPAIESLLNESGKAALQTAEFCAGLQALGLLDEFEADIRPSNADRKRVSGLWRVNEDRLKQLPAERLADLVRKGWLARIHAHLFSLENYGTLLDRHAAPVNAK